MLTARLDRFSRPDMIIRWPFLQWLKHVEIFRGLWLSDKCQGKQVHARLGTHVIHNSAMFVFLKKQILSDAARYGLKSSSSSQCFCCFFVFFMNYLWITKFWTSDIGIKSFSSTTHLMDHELCATIECKSFPLFKSGEKKSVNKWIFQNVNIITLFVFSFMFNV